MRSVKTSRRCPCLDTFLFLPRHRSVAHHGGASPNEVVLAQPIEVGYDIGLWVGSHNCPYNDCLLIIAVRRRFAEEQSREGELHGGGVAINHLPRDVQEDAVALLVRVIQRSVRHEEEVLRSQPESVRGGGGDGGADLLQLDGGGEPTVVAEPHAVQMDVLPTVQNTSVAGFSIVPYTHNEQCGRRFAVRRDNHDPVGRGLAHPGILAFFLACDKQQHDRESCQC